MGYLADFNKLHITVKSAVISVAVNMPFWWVAIYLMKRPLYDHRDFIILVPFCFCFSVTWYALNILAALVSGGIVEKVIEESNNKVDMDTVFIVGGIVSIVYLSAVMLLAYCFEWQFNTFLIVAYCYLFSNIGLMLGLIFMKMRMDNKAKAKLVS